ncbi:MAG: ribonuclease H-like domain-containing protein [Armatimonadetes bacterium]|nr:ribonuclease H-like domain-containing protein [Armatimonadota bacterium]
MLQHTFCHLPGVGPHTEAALWQAGIVDWQAALDCREAVGRAGPLGDAVAASQTAWEQRDWRHFGKLLGGRESWRWLPDLHGRCLYLDIETTGLSPGLDAVTVIACYDGQEVRCFVLDRDLGEFPLFVLGYELLITYNGATFDVPFLRARFPGLRLPPCHLDLRYPLARLGYTGGLKAIEQRLDVGRDPELRDIDGYLAVVLWHRHQRGDPRALPTLLRYAAEDVLSLEPLAELVYNRLAGPLPVPNPVLGPTLRRQIDWPYDLSVLR